MSADKSPFFKSRLMTPGPTDVPPGVLSEMAQPIIHHRTKAFQEIFADLSQRLQRLFRTENPVLTIAGSGTTAFEASQASLTKPGDKALSIASGKFGERWQDVFDQYGIDQIKIDVPWGDAVTVDQVKQAFEAHPEISVVTAVHSETSTATACDMKAIAEFVSTTNALLIVDGITAVGALPVEMDAWGIDVLITGSQKAMMLPPGLGFVGLGKRAVKRLGETPAGNYYNLDLRKWLKSWEKNDVPFTPPVSLIRGQRVALEMVEDRGLENVWSCTAQLATASRAAFEAMGLKLISSSPSDSVSGAYYPDGVDDSIRKSLREKHGISIAGGQNGRGADWKGKIFRINHMGFVDAGDTLSTLHALETEFIAAGLTIEPGTALKTAAQHL